MQHCSNAKQILASIAGVLEKNYEEKDQQKAAGAINDAYMKKVLGVTQ